MPHLKYCSSRLHGRERGAQSTTTTTMAGEEKQEPPRKRAADNTTKVNWTDEGDQTHTEAGGKGKSGWTGSCSPRSKSRRGRWRDCVLLQLYQKFYASTVNSVISAEFCFRGHITLCSEWMQFEFSKLWNSWVIRPQGHMMPSRYSTYLQFHRCLVCCCTNLISLFSLAINVSEM